MDAGGGKPAELINAANGVGPGGCWVTPCITHCTTQGGINCKEECNTFMVSLNAWLRQQEILENASPRWHDSLPECPCERYNWFFGLDVQPGEHWLCAQYRGWDYDHGIFSMSLVARFFPGWADLPSSTHPGATSCYRKATKEGHTQQCCYGPDNKLILRGMGAGSPDYNLPDHWSVDVEPWAHAWILDGSKEGSCMGLYLRYRPSNQGRDQIGLDCSHQAPGEIPQYPSSAIF
jgi:hypothetical protein